MVYDDAKNYIGDHHYRESDQIHEGDELKLDKGVLVEVGEGIGKTETDLAPIFEKSRPQKGSSTPRAPLRQLPSASTAKAVAPCSSARPRSLAEVLGASQGPIGRARLPTQSPYEQRQQTLGLINDTNEHPAKKRKLNIGKENRRPLERRILTGGSKGESATTKTSNTSAIHAQARQTDPRLARTGDANEACPDGNGGPRSLDASRTEFLGQRTHYSPPPNANQAIQQVASRSNVDQTIPLLWQDTEEERPRNPRLTRSSSTRTKKANGAKTTTSRSTSSEDNDSLAQQRTGRLRFAPSKPRIKLMYPILLADRSTRSSRSPARKSAGSTRIQNVSPPERPPQSPQSGPKRRVSKNIHLDSSSDNDMKNERLGISPSYNPSNRARENTPSPALDTGGSSPLFLPPTPPTHNQLESQQTQLLEDLDMDFSPIRELDFETSKPPFSPGKLAPETVACQTEDDLPSPRDPAPPPPSRLTLMDQQLLAPVLPPKSTSFSNDQIHMPVETSKLRRTQSENDAAIAAAEMFPRDSQAINTQVLPAEEDRQYERDEYVKRPAPSPKQKQKQLQKQKPFKPHAPPLRQLQKSVTDSATAAVASVTAPESATARTFLRTVSANSDSGSGSGNDREDSDGRQNQNQSQDQGPWSKAEAFDLFESWPRGREKPVYERERERRRRRRRRESRDGSSEMEMDGVEEGEGEDELRERPPRHCGGSGSGGGGGRSGGRSGFGFGFISDQLDAL